MFVRLNLDTARHMKRVHAMYIKRSLVSDHLLKEYLLDVLRVELLDLLSHDHTVPINLKRTALT